jgi:hypothetical protein
MKSIVNYILIGVGTLSIVLGILGIFLPLLPTTPLLLLGAACYMRGSKRLYDRLLANKWLGGYIRDYHENKGIPLRAKVVSIAALWVTMGFSIFFLIKFFWLRLILLAIAIGVTTFLLSQKTRISDSDKIIDKKC